MSKQQIQKLTEEYSHNPVTKKYERVAAYIRVSTQEQKLHGISLDAQRDKLNEYAKKNGLNIVAWYEDEGVSGRKLIKNRPALQRMLIDAQAGKFDRIIFIKLDRFFRSVAEYHECMKKIDPVLWTATEEKYDLTTANGRAFVNMKLTIAELEADQTGERINLVNEYKIKTGQAMTGAQSQGIAFTVVKDSGGVKRVVPDTETRDMVLDYINHFLTYQNKKQAHAYIKNKYDTDVTYKRMSDMLKNTKLYGFHRGNPNYCTPLITKEKFDKIQVALSKNIKSYPCKRVFIYSGLITCPCCGRKLSGKHSVNSYGTEYRAYRCSNNYINNTCEFKKQVSEVKTEAALLEDFNKYVSGYITEVDNLTNNLSESNNDVITKRIKEVKQEMSNSVKSFNKGRMTEEDHDKEYNELETQLKELEAQLEPVIERDLTIYEEIIKSDWKELYKALTPENKRAFWRKYIKEINVNMDGTINKVIFF